jgi:transcriptional regulator with XRE-family HTH domain
MATATRIDLAGGSVAASVARTIREARALVGWSQRELASRAGVSQATVWRAETGAAASLDMIVVGRLFAALALRSQLEVDDFRLDDRRPDMGGLQRSLAFYELSALAVARGLGWDAKSVTVLAVVLDTETVAQRLADHRDLVARAFPAPARPTAAWLADPTCARPQGWTLATCDPASRSARWLRPTTLGSRRTAPVSRNYADAADRLLRR